MWKLEDASWLKIEEPHVVWTICGGYLLAEQTRWTDKTGEDHQATSQSWRIRTKYPPEYEEMWAISPPKHSIMLFSPLRLRQLKL
jgi:hypothetical protein